jgi:hypothetical protein
MVIIQKEITAKKYQDYVETLMYKQVNVSIASLAFNFQMVNAVTQTA